MYTNVRSSTGFINYICFKLPTIKKKPEARKLNTIKNEIFIRLAQ